MKETTLGAVAVAENVYWVGAIDWSLRDFHGYSTERGTTYNAFLVIDEKVTLIDTVKATFHDEMMARIESIVPPEKIEYIISNHAEMDHSGCLPQVMAKVKPEKVFASTKGVEALRAHFHDIGELSPVKTGDSISLGQGTLSFIETRMLHWPDSMFSYLDSGGVLFTQDAFGMHLASAERFADEIEPSVLEFEAKKYYANILTPFSTMVERQIKELGSLDLPIKIIAPDHGPVYRQDLNWIIEKYTAFAAQKATMRAVLVYDTMWGSTEKMAKAIADGIVEDGGEVKVFPMNEAHRSNVATALLEAGALVVGGPTINGMLFPSVVDVLSYIRGLRPKNLVGAAFGSYGWSGESVRQIREALEATKVHMVGDDIKVKYVPTNEALAQCRALGKQIAASMAERCEKP